MYALYICTFYDDSMTTVCNLSVDGILYMCCKYCVCACVWPTACVNLYLYTYFFKSRYFMFLTHISFGKIKVFLIIYHLMSVMTKLSNHQVPLILTLLGPQPQSLSAALQLSETLNPPILRLFSEPQLFCAGVESYLQHFSSDKQADILFAFNWWSCIKIDIFLQRSNYSIKRTLCVGLVQ